MIDAIADAITALKGAADIVQTIKGMREATAIRTQIIDLQSKIIEANNRALAAQDERTTLLERISSLKTEVAGLKAWGAEREQYQPKNVGDGGVAYMLKPEARGTEQPHWLCPTCYAEGKKAFFQPTGDKSGRKHIYRCQGCGSSLATENEPEWIA
jgi:hypothetical protein